MIESEIRGGLCAVALITKEAGTAVRAVAGQTRQHALPLLAVGVMIAFMLDPFVGLLMRAHFPRGLATFVVCTIALALLYMIGLGAYSQLAAIYTQLPKYGERIGEIVYNARQQIEGMESRTYQLLVPARQRQQEQERLRQQQLADQARKKSSRKAAPPPDPVTPAPPEIPEVRIHEEATPIGDYIMARLNSFYQIVLMVSFVPFLVYFMLSWRDHINRSFLQFFHGEDRLIAARSLQGIAEMVRAFVVGNFLLGLLLALLSSVLFWSMHLPYSMLVGPLSGFLSLVPYIGMPLAMIPPLFSALAMHQFSTYVL